jgi:hypothetical protein
MLRRALGSFGRRGWKQIHSDRSRELFRCFHQLEASERLPQRTPGRNWRPHGSVWRTPLPKALRLPKSLDTKPGSLTDTPSLLPRPILRRYAHQTTKKYASYTTTGCSPPATRRVLSPWFLSFSLSSIPTTKNAPKRARVRAPSWTQRNLIRKSVLFRGDIQCQYARQKITESRSESFSFFPVIKSSCLQVQDGCEQSNMARAKRLKTTP